MTYLNVAGERDGRHGLEPRDETKSASKKTSLPESFPVSSLNVPGIHFIIYTDYDCRIIRRKYAIFATRKGNCIGQSNSLILK